MDSPSRRVVINVGGVRYETYASTLLTFPATKLASLAEGDPSKAGNYDPQHKEFFFDRNPKVFGFILDYYRTKHLHCSDDTCSSVLMEEMDFWEVRSTQLCHCCWLKMNSNVQAMEDFSSWNDAAQTEETGRTNLSWRQRWQPIVWNLFQMPYSSLAAMVNDQNNQDTPIMYEIMIFIGLRAFPSLT
ncbi:voltage-gated potassium channel KCNC1-like [Mantella aurantiaca]